jgi:hypothetical protein
MALVQIEERKVQENFNAVQKDFELKKTLDTVASHVGKYKGMTAIERFNARYSKPQEVAVTEEPVKKTGSRNTWTQESKKQFLLDYETMSTEELMEKYQFKVPGSVYTCHYRFSKGV